MERERRLSLVVGGFFLLALGGFAVIVLSLSARTGVWSRHYELEARFGEEYLAYKKSTPFIFPRLRSFR